MKSKGYRLVDVITPANGKVLLLNCYWLCKDGDPKQALFYNDTAQCNAHKSIPIRMKEYSTEKTGWDLEVVFIETAYKPNIIHNI